MNGVGRTLVVRSFLSWSVALSAGTDLVAKRVNRWMFYVWSQASRVIGNGRRGTNMCFGVRAWNVLVEPMGLSSRSLIS